MCPTWFYCVDHLPIRLPPIAFVHTTQVRFHHAHIHDHQVATTLKTFTERKGKGKVISGVVFTKRTAWHLEKTFPASCPRREDDDDSTAAVVSYLDTLALFREISATTIVPSIRPNGWMYNDVGVLILTTTKGT